MKKAFAIASITIMLSMICSCGNRHSKAFESMRKDVASIEGLIQETNDCDELQMQSFSILGLRSDLENLQQESATSEEEAVELNDLIDQLEASWNGKLMSLGCKQLDEEESEIDTSGEGDAADYDNL